MKTFSQLRAEIFTAARVRGISQETIMEEIVGWMDYTYHGVVELPFEEAGNPVTDPPPSGARSKKPEGRGLEE